MASLGFSVTAGAGVSVGYYDEEGMPISPSRTTRIEAEDFDRGGPGVAYHDLTPENWGNYYRPDEQVDLNRVMREQGKTAVCKTDKGEWINYTLRIVQAGQYRFRMRTARPADNFPGNVRVSIGNVTRDCLVYGQGGLNRFQEADYDVFDLPAGVLVMRVEFRSELTSIDWFELEPVNPAGEIASSVQSPTSTRTDSNLALNCQVWVSSGEGDGELFYAVDGNPMTRWRSRDRDHEWICVDLGNVQIVGRVVLNWGDAFASGYKIQTSKDRIRWIDQYAETSGNGGVDTVVFQPTPARYVRMHGTTRATALGISLFEMEVYAK